MSVGNGRTILFVDDSEFLLEMAQFHLQESGFVVVTATGVDAMRRCLAEGSFDLVVTDVQLPGCSTAALGEALRGIEAPVWLFSALDEVALAELTALVGADDYVCKREGLEALAARANTLLDT